MHWAVTLAEHSLRALTDARSWQPTLAWTVHVASHAAWHLSAQVDWFVEVHAEPH
jgi:hypothetical protein